MPFRSQRPQLRTWNGINHCIRKEHSKDERLWRAHILEGHDKDVNANNNNNNNNNRRRKNNNKTKDCHGTQEYLNDCHENDFRNRGNYTTQCVCSAWQNRADWPDFGQIRARTLSPMACYVLVSRESPKHTRATPIVHKRSDPSPSVISCHLRHGDFIKRSTLQSGTWASRGVTSVINDTKDYGRH